MPNYATKTNILLVDDNPNNLVTLEVILHDLDQNLIRAYSGEEALKQTLHREFAVILMDAYMPGMNGFEVARLLRERDKTRYTPIIFLSALYKDELDVRQGYALGAVDYIFKPIVPEILHSKVKVFVDLLSKSTYAQMLQKELKRRQRLEQIYKQLAQQTQVILSSVGEGICGLDIKGAVTFANPAAATILERSLAELIGQSLPEILNFKADITNGEKWEDHPFYRVIGGQDTYYTNEIIILNKNNREKFIEYTATTLKEQEGSQGAVLVFKDITERKRAEERTLKHQQQLALAQASRLNAMEEMASAMAHELTHPLAIIANYIKGCIHRMKQNNFDQSEILSIMERAVVQSERAGEVIHRIKNLARKGKLYYERIDINQLIEETIELMEEEITSTDTKINFEKDTQIPSIEVDKIQLQQVFLNLLRNSLEALAEVDHLIKQREISIETKLIDKISLEVNIKDNGPGFSVEIIDTVFDAYFTSKPNGMGMGLAISRTIIEAHGGCLIAKHNPTGGAWFQFTLPISSL